MKGIKDEPNGFAVAVAIHSGGAVYRRPGLWCQSFEGVGASTGEIMRFIDSDLFVVECVENSTRSQSSNPCTNNSNIDFVIKIVLPVGDLDIVIDWVPVANVIVVAVCVGCHEFSAWRR